MAVAKSVSSEEDKDEDEGDDDWWKLRKVSLFFTLFILSLF